MYADSKGVQIQHKYADKKNVSFNHEGREGTQSVFLLCFLRVPSCIFVVNITRILSHYLIFAAAVCGLMGGCRSTERAAELAYQEGLLQKEQGAFEQAIQQFRLALTHQPHHAPSHIELGILLCRKQEYRQAVKHFLQAREYGSESYKLSALMGYAYERLKNWQEAERCYQQAITLSPNLIDVRLRLADLLEQQAKRQEAAKVIKDILAIKPDIEDADLLVDRASLLSRRSTSDIHERMADLYIRYGHIERGLAEYRQAVGVESDDPDDLIAFGRFCLERKQFPTALLYFQHAKALGREQQVDVRAGLGAAYEELGQYEEAVQEYRAALQLDPEWYELRLKVAELLKKIEKPSEAADELEQFFYLAHHNSSLTLGTGGYPDANHLWAEILHLREESSHKAVVQLKPSTRYPVIDAVVNQKTPAVMRIEERAEYTIVSPEMAQRLGIQLTSRTSEVLFHVDGQMHSAPLINLPSLKIGELEVRNISTVIWDLSNYHGIDGFLGQSFLKHFQSEIHYDDQLFILTKFSS